MYSAELVANQFVGPPLAGLLLAVGFALPFVVDAGSFAVSAALVFSIAATPRSRTDAEPARRRRGGPRRPRGSGGCGSHDLLRTLAITLGLLNMFGNVGGALIVL